MTAPTRTRTPSDAPSRGTPKAPLRMDPRLRRRRIEVLRQEGRRRLRSLAAAGGVVVLAGGAALATRTPLLDVDYVDVRGIEQVERAELLRATGLDAKPQLVDVRTSEVVRLAEALPCIADARAEKVWPGTVRLHVEERTAVAAVPADGGGWALLDEDGLVLEVMPERPPGPALAGLAPAPAPGQVLRGADGVLAVAAALPAAVRDKVAEVRAAKGGHVDLQLVPSGMVKLGPPDDVAAKLRSLETMLTKADLRRLAVLDLRVPSAPVVTRR